MTRRNASVMKVGVTCTYQEVLVRASNNTKLLKTVVPLSYQRINFKIKYIAGPWLPLCIIVGFNYFMVQ